MKSVLHADWWLIVINFYREQTRRKMSKNIYIYLLAPVHTILPELKIRAVVRGSRIRMMTAAKRLGLYSAFLAWSAIFFRSNLQSRFTVQTMFLKNKKTNLVNFKNINFLKTFVSKPIKLSATKLNTSYKYRIVYMSVPSIFTGNNSHRHKNKTRKKTAWNLWFVIYHRMIKLTKAPPL